MWVVLSYFMTILDMFVFDSCFWFDWWHYLFWFIILSWCKFCFIWCQQPADVNTRSEEVALDILFGWSNHICGLSALFQKQTNKQTLCTVKHNALPLPRVCDCFRLDIDQEIWLSCLGIKSRWQCSLYYRQSCVLHSRLSAVIFVWLWWQCFL